MCVFGCAAMSVLVPTDGQAFETAVKAHSGLVVLYFWASWYEPCQAVTPVVESLAREHKNVLFVKADVEELADVAAPFKIESVPTCVFLLGNAILARQEGANIPELVALVTQHASRAALKQVTTREAPVVDEMEAKAALDARLSQLISAAPVMLFMKGSPDAPQCGFSRTTVGLLKEQGVTFGYFDILTDNEVRQGLKVFSNWKTYPQIYANGELLGGLDVVRELIQEGEFKSMLPAEVIEEPLEQRLAKLVRQHKVMLFMKGDPTTPKCGFSRSAIALLNETGVEYGTFDILLDLKVREGLKTFSNWPTYPQLYVDGELVGGLDVLRELQDDGELAELLAGNN
jgi:Grx4 family monothiol glutaredoxin